MNWGRTLPGRATIRSDVPGWRDAFPYNNEAEAWAHFHARGGYHPAKAHLGIAMAHGVEQDLGSKLGETAYIRFSAANRSIRSKINTQDDLFAVRVRFDPTPGLRLAASNPPAGTSVTAQGTALLWDVGTLYADPRDGNTAQYITIEVTPTLPGVEQCVDVEMTSDAPLARHTERFCLGDHPILFRDGRVAPLTVYPCVNTDLYPCHAEDTVEVAAFLEKVIASSVLGIRAYRSTPDNPTVVIQVSDPLGRVIDSHSHSVTSGGAPSWHTARDDDHNPIKVDGVQVGYRRVPFNDQLAVWGTLTPSVTVAGLNGNPAPGRVKIRYPDNGETWFDPNPSDPGYTFALTSRSSRTINFFAEFSKLGTYVVDFTAAALHNGGTAATSDDKTYTGTGRTIFHVGPIAELEANAAWTGSGAFTITARNNGPDDAPAARVKVSLPQGMRFIRAEASEGSYNPNSGVWNIGRLALPGYRAAASLPEDATLTVYTEPTGEAVTQPVTATIANHQDYTVTINGTTHSTNYYDYIPGNNKVSLAAPSTAPAGAGDSATIHVTGISATSSPDAAKGYYLPGQDLEVEATFSDTVTADASAKLLLQVGQSLREAAAIPSTGEAIRFRYRVQWADRTDPAKPLRVTANPFAGPEAAIQAAGDGTLSLRFPGQDLGLRHAIGPQPDWVADTNVPMWSEPVFLTIGQEGARYRYIDGMRHYYAYDSLTRRWEYEFRLADADPGLSDDDLDLVLWLTLRASGYYGTFNPHPYEDDAHPVPGRPYLGRWDGGSHYRHQTCWGLEADFSPGKTREQRLRELGRVLVQRISWGRVDWEISGGQWVSSMLDYAHAITPETCPDVPEERLNPPGQASPPPGGASIVGLEMNSVGPYKAGDAIEVAVIFDRDVKVTGGPQLAIEVGGSSRTAKYSAGPSKPRSMVFRYTVLNDDRDSDGVGVYPGSIVLPAGASIRDAQRTDALLGHEGLAAQRGHTVGPVKSGQTRGTPGAVAPPAVVTGLAMRGSGPYGEGDAVSVAATFDWDVTVAGTPELNIEVGGSSRAALYQPSLSDTAVKVFSYTVQPDDRDADGVSVYPGSITLPQGASVRDDQGTDADLTITGLPPQLGHTVDGSQEGAPDEDEQQQQASGSEPQTVAADWPLIPEGIGPGDSFRLVFVTSVTRDASSSDIADYNAFVQAAANGNDNLKPFSGEFRALISTAAVDAKTNTGTTGEGVIIHWLGGAQVADDYADLYDGDWDSANGRTESGSGYTGLVWTGGNKSGEKSGQRHAGAGEVRLGDLGDSTLALSSPTTRAASESYPLYALSPVITVAARQQQQAANNEPEFALDSDTRGVAENAATGSNVGDPVTASDADSDELTYALTGSGAFAIDPSTGQITVAGPLDHETQSSYALTVSVSDGKNASGGADSGVDDTIAITINVGNADEAGTVSFNAGPPRAGSPLTASLNDPDGGVNGLTWSWESSADGTNWTAIGGESGASYTPSDDDVGSYLRATAGYADRHGSGKSAVATTASAVAAAPAPTPTPEPEPAVTAGPAIVSSPKSGDTYGEGEAIVVAVTFSEAVTASGDVRVRLTVGERQRWARYDHSREDGTVLAFAYQVKKVDADPDGVSIGANQLQLRGGTVTDGDGNAANLEHSAVPDQSGHKVDGSLEQQPAQQQQAAANNEPEFALDSDARSVAENAAVGSNVGDPVTATDADGDELTYALTGSGAFAIDAGTGQITVAGALDYETQSSYGLTVAVSDGKNASGRADSSADDTIAITVSVGNVDEAGRVTLSADPPQAGSPLTATLNDPDGGVNGLTWTWESSADGTNWAAIDGASEASYTPSDDDAGSYLRATASYGDGHGSGKSALADTASAVAAAPAAQQQQAPTVPADSPLVPTGLGPGDSFRLLFVTSTSTKAESADIADYNKFVQTRAAANTNLADFSGQFTAYISTATVDARDNTGTTGTGVSIHWLGGEKVSDDYADLYDGDWDSVSGKTEGGSSYTGLVWTGGNKQGGKSGQRHAGAAEVRMGDLGAATLPLSSPAARAATESHPLYALSPVITVAQPE